MPSIPFKNEPATNLVAGIQAAAAELSGPAHRPNARKVMMVFATAFNPQGSHPPQEVAQTFIEDGGVIIVYNYVPLDGIQIVNPTLESIASPGYFFTNLDRSFQVTDIDNAICDGKSPLDKSKLLANCFCPNSYSSFRNSLRKTPTAGCYKGADGSYNYPLASNKCKLSNNGFVAFDESYNKTIFLGQKLQNNPVNFWIGLVWDQISYRWEWSDGTSVGSYQPWFGGSAPTGSSSLGCTYINTNNQWVATDCRNSLAYICEASPCDSLHYCP